jgi:threonyl-tRNA synthetase
VLAEAVQELWPGTQVTIGPVIENGFYYDFFRNEPFTPDDFAAIEKKMREIIAARQAVHQGSLDAREAKGFFRDKGEAVQGRAGRRHSRQPGSIKIYKQGDWFDLCRGPHMTSTGKIGNAFKLMKVAGAYWRGDEQPDADAHLRHGLGHAGGARRLSPACWRKPRSATIASSAARWTCSISRKRGRASCSGTPRAGRCSRP